MFLKILAMGGALLAASACFADVITFDDIPVPTGFDSYVPIPNGYHSFNWNNFYAYYGPGSPNTGYAAGVVSSPNVAFNGAGQPANFSSLTPFTFTSAYFTAAWNDVLSITIQGLNGATVVDSTTLVVNATVPALTSFDWTGLTEVVFASSGGTLHMGYNGGGTQFVLDNLTINAVPEPSSLLLTAIAVSGLVLLCGKRFSGTRFCR